MTEQLVFDLAAPEPPSFANFLPGGNAEAFAAVKALAADGVPYEILDPILQLFRQTSALALYPVFILLLGLGEASKVFVIFWATLFPVLLATIGGGFFPAFAGKVR